MGKISRIQLRGISRTPSDRLTSDGGCAESLNAYLQDSEIAPALIPDDVTDIVGSDATYKAKKVFIHKTANYENYILHLEQNNQIGSFVNGSFKAFLTLDSDETLTDITSIGNTIIIATSKKMSYVLYKENIYINLGNSIPHINLEFKPRYQSQEYGYMAYVIDENSPLEYDDIKTGGSAAWKAALKDPAHDLDITTVSNAFWSETQRAMTKLSRYGYFYYPVFLRYAFKLFDGSYIYHSAPILVGPKHRRFFEAQMYNWYYTEAGKPTDKIRGKRVSAILNQAYDIQVQLLNSSGLSNWANIVDSVEIFISEPVLYPSVNSVISEVGEGDTSFNIYFQNPIGSEKEESSIKDSLLSTALFYKIKSVPLSNLSELEEGTVIENSEEFYLTEKLYVKERLPDDFRSNHEIAPSLLYTYNDRLIAGSITEKAYPGEPQPNAISIAEGTTVTSYEIYYELVDSNNKHLYVKGKGFNSSDFISLPKIAKLPVSDGRVPSGSTPGTTTYYSSAPYGFLAYPDTRCVAVYFRTAGASQWKKVPMMAHPNLQCAYAYWGIDKSLFDLSDLSTASSLTEDNVSLANKQYLFQSAVSNPFYFPVSGRKKQESGIIDICVAATPLSQGQFGQFPLYIFTEDGIWAMETASDGSFVTSKPLSREVCLSRDSVTPLDQAVVFISAKGVMLLDGSQVIELSPNMNGKHYTIEAVARTIIEGTTYSSLLPAATDPDPFMNFMKDAKIAYDYAGKRLIFISPSNQGYQYIYKLDTNTWHKLTLGLNLQDPVNSYPDCLVTGTDGTHTKIYDLSTLLDVADTTKKTAKILVATRPFDLEEPDVYKTITAIRVRGQYAAGAVNFILQGSHDGINFYTVNTLRGKSWKLFRLIILANLSPTERISWVDVEYETRFTNKLR